MYHAGATYLQMYAEPSHSYQMQRKRKACMHSALVGTIHAIKLDLRASPI